MAALQPYVDQDELFLDRHVELEWADDVEGYRCTRCHKVLVQHYIANCEHKFCGNCKRVVDDGSHRWRCPHCRHFIEDIGQQSPQFKDEVIGLRVHCLNRKYGCPHICPFKYLKEHLAGCEHTKEQALPVLIPEGPTIKMLDRMFSAQLLNLKNDMNRKLDAMEKRNAERDESARELSLKADEMQRVMLQIEKRQKDGEEKAFKLNKKTKRLENEIDDLQKQPMRSNSLALEGLSLAVEESKTKIVKLEAKSESYFEMLDTNNRKNFEEIQRLKNEVEKELKKAQIQTQSEIGKLEQTINDMSLEQKKKWAETKDELIEIIKKEQDKREEVTSTVNTISSQLTALNAKVTWLEKVLQNQRSEVNQSIATMGLTWDESVLAEEKKWVENDRKWAEVDARINKVISDLQKASTSVISSTVKKKMNENEEEEEFNKRKQTLSLEQQIYNSIIKPEVHHLRRVSEYYKEAADFTWIVSHINVLTSGNPTTKLFSGSARELLSEAFRLKEYPFTAQMKMTRYDDDHNKIWFCMSFNDRTSESIEIKPLPNIFLTLKDQSNNNNERKNIIKLSYTYNSLKEKFKYNDFYLVGFVNKNILQSAPYNVGDKIEIDIHVETPEVAQMVYSHDGTLTWAIDDCRKRKQMEVDGLIESHLSPYFYTGPNGYRMQLKIRLNGYGDFEHKGLSARVVFLSGLYDEHLDTKFSYKNVVTIFHPQQHDRIISKSEESVYDRWHRHSFDMGSHAEIEDFLYNDTLFYKVAIEIIKSPIK